MTIERIATSNGVAQTIERPLRMEAEDLDPPFLARPSGLCCLKGTIHSGNPRGSFSRVADVETYVVKPPEHKRNGHILLYYPDVWGMFTNGLLIMDSFADAGYLTIGLDYFRGVCGNQYETRSLKLTVLPLQDPVWKHRKNRSDTTSDPGFDYEAWKRKHMAFAKEAVPRWNAAVKQKFGNPSTRYACVGWVSTSVSLSIIHTHQSAVTVSVLHTSATRLP